MTTDIKAIFLDAVGTLLVPEPAAAAVYAEVGRRHGSRLSFRAIRERFAAPFSRQDAIDRQHGWRTSEDRERRRWEEIVDSVLDDVADRAACFRELYGHFSTPAAWKLNEGAPAVLAALVERGFTLGIASNFDHRLRNVVAGLPELRQITHLVISSEIGWRKPAGEFYAAMIRAAGCSAQQVLYIGDDRINDYDGGRAAGLRAILFDPNREGDAGARRIARLLDLMSFV